MCTPAFGHEGIQGRGPRISLPVSLDCVVRQDKPRVLLPPRCPPWLLQAAGRLAFWQCEETAELDAGALGSLHDLPAASPLAGYVGGRTPGTMQPFSSGPGLPAPATALPSAAGTGAFSFGFPPVLQPLSSSAGQAGGGAWGASPAWAAAARPQEATAGHGAASQHGGLFGGRRPNQGTPASDMDMSVAMSIGSADGEPTPGAPAPPGAYGLGAGARRSTYGGLEAAGGGGLSPALMGPPGPRAYGASTARKWVQYTLFVHSACFRSAICTDC